MRVLVSGFEAFGGMDINPTEALARVVNTAEFAGKFPGAQVKGVVLPVFYDECVDRLVAEVNDFQPDVVIACGLANGRLAVTPERIGINTKGVEGAGDNRGNTPLDGPIAVDGPDGIFSTLPIARMVANLRSEGIPAAISNSAGTYICNNTMYGILHHIQTHSLPIRAGFVHFPASSEMVVNKPNSASLPQATLERAIEVLVRTVIED